MLRNPQTIKIQIINGSQFLKRGYSQAAAVPQSTEVTKTENNDRSKGRKMAGWQIHSYGDLSELQYSEKLRVPVIRKPTEILIKINSSSVNPIDVAMVGKFNVFFCFFYV